MTIAAPLAIGDSGQFAGSAAGDRHSGTGRSEASASPPARRHLCNGELKDGGRFPGFCGVDDMLSGRLGPRGPLRELSSFPVPGTRVFACGMNAAQQHKLPSRPWHFYGRGSARTSTPAVSTHHQPSSRQGGLHRAAASQAEGNRSRGAKKQDVRVSTMQ